MATLTALFIIALVLRIAATNHSVTNVRKTPYEMNVGEHFILVENGLDKACLFLGIQTDSSFFYRQLVGRPTIRVYQFRKDGFYIETIKIDDKWLK